MGRILVGCGLGIFLAVMAVAGLAEVGLDPGFYFSVLIGAVGAQAGILFMAVATE